MRTTTTPTLPPSPKSPPSWRGRLVQTRPRPISWPPGSRPTPLVTLSLAALAVVSWVLVGDPWELTGDATRYLGMVAGEAAPAPFGYRVLTPALVARLPLPPQAAFASVSWLALVATAGLLVDFVRRTRPHATGWTLALLCLSFPMAYYATSQVRVDPLMLAAIAGALAIAARGGSAWLLALVVGLGSLSHELALVLIPVLWVDRVLDGGLLGQRRLTWTELALLTAVAGGLFVGVRAGVSLPTEGAEASYLTTPGAIVAHALAKSGGVAAHGQRIYAAYGPALVFALAGGVLLGRGKARGVIPCVLALASVVSLLAVDTLRVLAVFFPVLLPAAAAWIAWAWRRAPALGATLLGSQIGFSWIVFAHLRTFEGSRDAVLAALALSAVAGLATGIGALLWARPGLLTDRAQAVAPERSAA